MLQRPNQEMSVFWQQFMQKKVLRRSGSRGYVELASSPKNQPEILELQRDTQVGVLFKKKLAQTQFLNHWYQRDVKHGTQAEPEKQRDARSLPLLSYNCMKEVQQYLVQSLSMTV
ncbi:Hypothetical_protein [Hexamita inflata]|uniref:Hypothetical_protein n=1 Tax=Hexamita inflata TaxID=28002 RepID=A0AA86QBR5_9EUKA|nr:Hypothetical protein HINF_LOCUS37732 [Hexamita inflata]